MGRDTIHIYFSHDYLNFPALNDWKTVFIKDYLRKTFGDYEWGYNSTLGRRVR